MNHVEQYCKKKDCHAKFFPLLIAVLPLDSNDSIIFFKNQFLSESIKKEILGAFKYLASTFHFFVEKGVVCAISPILKIQ